MTMKSKIDRAKLENLHAAFTHPNSTPPPRELDIEVFRLFYRHRVIKTEGGYHFINPAFRSFEVDEKGRHPAISEPVPRYGDKFDDANCLRFSILSERLLIEEVINHENPLFLPQWSAKLIDESGAVTGTGLSSDVAAAILIALFARLLDGTLLPPQFLTVEP